MCIVVDMKSGNTLTDPPVKIIIKVSFRPVGHLEINCMARDPTN